MPKYINKNYKDRESMSLGPYTAVNGVVETTPENDKIVGKILTTYYGFEKIVSDEMISRAENKAIGQNDKTDENGTSEQTSINPAESTDGSKSEGTDTVSKTADKDSANKANESDKDKTKSANDSIVSKL